MDKQIYERFFAALCERVKELSDGPVTCVRGLEPDAFGSTNVPWIRFSGGTTSVAIYVPVLDELRIEIDSPQLVGYSEEYVISFNRPAQAKRAARHVGQKIHELLSHSEKWRKVEEGFVFELPSGELFFQE